MSEHLRGDYVAFKGTGMPDMLGSPRLAIKTKTQKSKPPVVANYVETSQKMSAIYWSKSVFLLMKKQYTEYEAILVSRQPPR